MPPAILTWTESGSTMAIFNNRIVVRRTKDDTSTAIFVDGVMHTVTEPFDQVVQTLSNLRG